MTVRIGFDPKELENFKAYWSEFYQIHAKELDYYVYDLSHSIVDDFYMEAIKTSKVFVNKKVLFYFPTNEEIDKMGMVAIEEQREVIFTGCVELLRLSSVSPKIGDRVSHDNTLYEIKTVKNKDNSYFGQTNYCAEIVMSAERIRDGN